MRQQDRLLQQLEHRDSRFRAFTLRRLERVPIHFDSDELLTRLRAGWSFGEMPLAAHYLCAWNELYPRHLRLWHDPSLTPVRSQMVGNQPATALPREPARPPADTGGRALFARSATHLLEPCVLALRKRAEAARGTERRRFVTALSRFHHETAESFLWDLAGDDQQAPWSLLLLAACQGLSDSRRLVQRLSLAFDTELLPQLLLALRYAPAPETAALLQRASGHRSPGARWVAAMCADRYGQHGFEKILPPLLDSGGWAAVHALETLGRLGRGPAAWPLIDRLLQREKHPLLRATALRVLASLGGPDALPACARELATPVSEPSLVQAAITVGQLNVPAPDRARLLTPLLKSESLDAVVAAILGLVGADDQRAGRAIRDLLVEGGEPERIAAAYCLAYYPGQSSVLVLENLIRGDASPAVRRQALRSFAYFEKTPLVNERLLSFLQLAEPALASDAARILATPDNAGNADIAQAVVRASREGPAQLAACRSLGRFTTANTRALAAELVRRKDSTPDTVVAAAEALGSAPAPAPDLDGLRGALTQPSPAVRATAARVLFSWGSFEGVETLTRMLSGPEIEAHEAARAAEELATIADFLVDEPRFAALSSALRANAQTPAYLEFSRRQLGLTSAPDLERAAADPEEIVLSRATWQEGGLGGQPAPAVVADVEAARRAARPRRPRPRRETLQLEKLDEPGPSDSRRRWAIVAAVSLAIGFLSFAGAALTRSEKPAAPPVEQQSYESSPLTLVASTVTGTVRVTPAGGVETPLSGGAPIEPGSAVTASTAASVTLELPPKGNRLQLTGEGGFTFGALELMSAEEDMFALKLSEPRGTILFDVKWGRPRLQVMAGRFVLRAWRGRYLLEVGPDGSGWVKVGFGRIELTAPAGQTTLLTEGRRCAFDAKTGTTQLSDFEPAGETWR